MSFSTSTPRKQTAVEVLFTNKGFVYEDASRNSSLLKVGKPNPGDPGCGGTPSQNGPFSSTGIENNTEYSFGGMSQVDNNHAISYQMDNDHLLIDYNNYTSVGSILLPENEREKTDYPLSLQVVSNHFDLVNDVQLILVTFMGHLEVHSLKTVKTNKNTEMQDGFTIMKDTDFDGGKKIKEDVQFSITKLQECSNVKAYGPQIQCSALSQQSCVSSGTKRLMYAVSILGSETFFLIREEAPVFSDIITLNTDEQRVTEIASQNCTAVTNLAFNFPDEKNEDFLAFLDDGRVCSVCSIQQEVCLVTFPLKSPGVALSFHPYEQYKLMVVEMSGIVQIFNIAKQCAVQSVNVNTRLLCAHWCLVDPLFVAVGSVENCFIIDLSKPYITPSTQQMKPFFRQTIQKLMFSNVDAGIMMFWGKPDNQIKLFKRGENIHSWAKTDKHIMCDVAWAVQSPLIIVLSGKRLNIYDSS